MDVVLLGIIIISVYFVGLYLSRSLVTSRATEVMEFSANVWITLGGIALLASYHQEQKNAAREQATLALKLSEKWGDINEYLVQGDEDGSLKTLIRALYGLDGGMVNIDSPRVRMAIDYIIEKCYEMWVLTVGMNISVSSFNTASDYTDFDPTSQDTSLASDATQPIHILVGSVFANPEFYALLVRGKRFYPDAFTDYVNMCITLFRSRKNPRTGKFGFVKGDKLERTPGGL